MLVTSRPMGGVLTCGLVSVLFVWKSYKLVWPSLIVGLPSITLLKLANFSLIQSLCVKCSRAIVYSSPVSLVAFHRGNLNQICCVYSQQMGQMVYRSSAET